MSTKVWSLSYQLNVPVVAFQIERGSSADRRLREGSFRCSLRIIA